MDPFQPPGEAWTAVSPKLITARRISALLSALPLFTVGLLLALASPEGFPAWVGWAVVGTTLIALLWSWVVIGRRVRSWGYVERADDLVVASGIWFRRLVVVPYGRMQLVDVQAGPIDRALGIATVQLHTAAATSDAAIPGLEPEVAAALRDRLAALGEQRNAGL